MDGVTVITGPRTGAGHLFALLRNFEAVAPSDGLFSDGYQEAAGKIDRFELDAAAERKSVIVLKATATLPREVVERDLLGRSGMRTIFVVRRLIDTYVSLAKATALGAWRGTDLTPIRVKLDAGHFATWLDEQQSWYGHWSDWLQRRAYPVPVIRYETQLTVPVESVLRRFASTVAQVGISLRMPVSFPYEGLIRQDREKTVALKVKNWPDFSKGLIARGIEKRAFGYPI